MDWDLLVRGLSDVSCRPGEGDGMVQNMRIIVTASAIAWMGGKEAKGEASQKMIEIIKCV
jgi:hypothetical protein